MFRRKNTSSARPGEHELPVVHRFRRGGKKPSKAFQQASTLPWIFLGVVVLLTLVLMAFLVPELTQVIVVASTAAALFFLLFAFGLIAKLGSRAAIVAAAVTGLLYAVTAWTPLVGVKSVLVLAMVVAFIMFALAGFNVLFVVEEVLFDIHRHLHIRGTFWNAIPTFILVGVTPLVYVFLPLLGLRWPTLSIGMPLVLLLLATAWIVRWRAGPHGMRVVREAHFISVGIIVGAGLADIVAMLRDVEGILPSIIAYLTLIVTWVFVSYNTLQRAQYFLPANDVLPWIALLFASAFAVFAHVQFLYDVAGAPGLAAVSEVRVSYLQIGVWLGLAFFVVRGGWRFVRFIRDERGLGSGSRRTAGRVVRVLEEVMDSSTVARRMGEGALQTVNRVIPGGRGSHKKKGKKGRK